MISFLFKGLIRDKHRSLFPLIVISLGVMLTAILYSWMNGIMGDIVDYNARIDTGHVKIVTRAYWENIDQLPNDLALTSVDTLLKFLRQRYPEFDWTPRIKFGGLLDVPDSMGETKAQHPFYGIAADLLGAESHEGERMRLEKAIRRGALPRNAREILITDEFARRMQLAPKQSVTLLSTTANNATAARNFVIAGTITFGVAALDRGAIIADVGDIQEMLDMQNGTGEILGFHRTGRYEESEVQPLAADFPTAPPNTGQQFSAVAHTLGEQNGLGEYLQYAGQMGFIFIGIFLFAMSIVLWNAGLMAGMRRYGEFGVRLAMGETKGGIFLTLLLESFMTGILGSIIGTALGLAFSAYLQRYGLDLSDALKNSSLVISDRVYAKISATSCFIGFIPGLFATLIGAALAGFKIYRRQTATLFKELEV